MEKMNRATVLLYVSVNVAYGFYGHTGCCCTGVIQQRAGGGGEKQMGRSSSDGLGVQPCCHESRKHALAARQNCCGTDGGKILTG